MKTNMQPHPMGPTYAKTVYTAPTDAGRFFASRGYLILALLVLVLWLNLTFLVPVVMGAIFAAVLMRMMDWLEKFPRLAHRKALRASIVTTTFVLGFLIPLTLLIIFGANAAVDKLQGLEDSQQVSIGELTQNPSSAIDALGLRPLMHQIAEYSPISEAQVVFYAKRGLVAMGTLAGKALQAFIASLPAVMFSNIVMLFTIFFLLMDGRKAVAFVRENSIFGRKQTDKLIRTADDLCYSVMAASLASGAVQAALIGVSCIVTGTEGSILIVFVAFLLSFFPMIGNAPVTVGLTLFSFMKGNTTAGFIFLAFIFLVAISDNFVRPLVLKGGARLHPLVGFVAAFGALDMIGFYGLFIGPVVVGIFFAMLPMVTRSYPKSPRTA